MHKKLYILPFDHRGSFLTWFGFSPENLTPEVIAKLSDYKHVIFEGFLKSFSLGVPKESAAILVDEQFGAQIHEEARTQGITRILTAEKSGQDEFDFEYGDAFGEHIEKFTPDYVKVLVRYNSHGDRAMNERQCAHLKLMNDFCATHGYRFLFELLAVATPEELAQCGGKEAYDKTLRAAVMAESIAELKRHGIFPDIWKIEGLDDAEQMRRVVEETQRNAKKPVGVIILGRDESEEHVRRWLTVAAGVPHVIGFAVGRTVFETALIAYHRGEKTREEAAETIAKNYAGFVKVFEKANS